MSFTLESAELATLATRLVALASIYSEDDCKTAARYLRDNCAGDPNNEPEEEAAFRAIIALFETN